jgi:superfamily II DNA/RNA helicase
VTQLQVPAGREAHDKRDVLRRLLRDAKDLQNAIIFCNRKREVAVLYKSLQKHGFSVGALHGDMDQSARTAALDQFRKGEIPLLVASDVAARGLDIPTTSHVFNFDVPHHPDDYVHRIGRTGRAGRAGTAISIVSPLDHKSMAAIEKLIGQTIPRAEGDFTVRAEATVEGERPRDHRSRDGSRRGGRGKPQREREPRQESRQESHKETRQESRPEARHEPRREARQEGGSRRHQGPSQPQGSATSPRPAAAKRGEPRQAEAEPADHSHLPAFLLKPVRARV